MSTNITQHGMQTNLITKQVFESFNKNCIQLNHLFAYFFLSIVLLLYIFCLWKLFFFKFIPKQLLIRVVLYCAIFWIKYFEVESLYNFIFVNRFLMLICDKGADVICILLRQPILHPCNCVMSCVCDFVPCVLFLSFFFKFKRLTFSREEPK